MKAHQHLWYLFFLSIFSFSTLNAQCPEQVLPVNSSQEACSGELPAPPTLEILDGVDNPENAFIIWNPPILESVINDLGNCEPLTITFNYSIGCTENPDLIIPGGTHSMTIQPEILPPVINTWDLGNGECGYNIEPVCDDQIIIPDVVDPLLEVQTFIVINSLGCSQPFTLPIPSCIDQPIVDIKAIDQLYLLSPVNSIPSSNAELVFQYFLPPDAPPQYLQVFYQPPGSTQVEWILDNFYLEPFPDSVCHSIWFDLLLPPSNPFIELAWIDFFVTEEIIQGPPNSLNLQAFPTGSSIYNIGPNPPNPDGLSQVFPPGTIFPPKKPRVWDSGESKGVLIGCNLPNIDLDSSRYSMGKPDNIPGYARRLECLWPRGNDQ